MLLVSSLHSNWVGCAHHGGFLGSVQSTKDGDLGSIHPMDLGLSQLDWFHESGVSHQAVEVIDSNQHGISYQE